MQLARGLSGGREAGRLPQLSPLPQRSRETISDPVAAVYRVRPMDGCVGSDYIVILPALLSP